MRFQRFVIMNACIICILIFYGSSMLSLLFIILIYLFKKNESVKSFEYLVFKTKILFLILLDKHIAKFHRKYTFLILIEATYEQYATD